MRVSVILAHPDKSSFNHAIASAVLETLARNGHQALFHDLYSEGFDPLLPAKEIPRGAALDPLLKAHCDEIASVNGIVVVHPNWWGQPPAILKGWIDRVVRPGVAYMFKEGDGGEGVPVGLLKARAALVFNTGNTELSRERSVFGDPLESIWRNCVFGLCGVKDFRRELFTVVVSSSESERKAWLERARQLTNASFPA